jgi:hypothetical protein
LGIEEFESSVADGAASVSCEEPLLEAVCVVLVRRLAVERTDLFLLSERLKTNAALVIPLHIVLLKLLLHGKQL